MITSMNRGRHARSGRLMILPVAVILFCLFAFRVVPGPGHSGAGRAGSGEPLTVMIDAGHGGIDPGASGYFGGVDEKVLTLQLAQAIKAHEAEYNVHVVLTRNEDVLPGGAADKQQGLVNRVDMAKAAGAKAFISLHVNNDGKPGATTETGYECFISKNRESKGSELLASSLLKRLGSVYTTKQQIMKRSEEGIYVLDHNDCSAVLLECGFINNAKDVAFFKNNQDVIAKTILQGIVDAQAAR